MEHYLDLLERTFVIFRLPAFSTNPRQAGSAAFRAAYGVNVELIGPANPFVADLLNP